MGFQRLRVGNRVLYTPTAAEASANGAGPWIATIVEVLSSGNADLLVQAPDPSTIGSAVADPLISAAALADTDGILDGLTVGTPTTPSSQITGAGATDWNVDVAAGHAIVDSVEKQHAAQADFSIHDTTQLLTNGQAIYAWVLEQNNAGTVSTVVVKGTAATSGSEVAPTDGEIDTALSSLPYIKLALCHLHRDGDTSVVQTQQNIYRQLVHDAKTVANELRTDVIALAQLVNQLRTGVNAFRVNNVARGSTAGTFAFIT